MKQYKQIADVPWLHTPAGTIWEETGIDAYIQPEKIYLWDTPFGVDLSLLDDKDLDLFEPISG